MISNKLIVENQNLEKSDSGFNEREKINIHYNEEDTNIVDTVSKYWLSMEELKKEKQFSDAYISLIDNLQKQFAGWRRVRGDGNCYYRSVIVAFMLKIFHYYENDLRIYSLICVLQNINLGLDEIYEGSKQRVLEFLLEEYKERNNNYEKKINSFIKLNQKLQEKSFDNDLIRVSRLISYAKFIMCMEDDNEIEVKPYVVDNIEDIKRQLLDYGREAEGIELKLLPYGLGISVHQINILDNALTTKYPNEDTPEDRLIVSIISKSRGHYDILYTIQDMEDQEYCIAERCFYYEVIGRN